MGEFEGIRTPRETLEAYRQALIVERGTLQRDLHSAEQSRAETVARVDAFLARVKSEIDQFSAAVSAYDFAIRRVGEGA